MEWVLFITLALAGLMVGSFLNVVIHRGPVLWGLIVDEPDSRGGLLSPRSYCPSCRMRIRAQHLAPVIGYAMLGGKCASCKEKISVRYPVVEMLGGLAAVAALLVFGITPIALLAAFFLFALIALAFIDLETGYLPDAITIPLIGAGLVANLWAAFVSFQSAVIGAVAGFAVFAAVSFFYQRLRGREGLGGGDAKLLAALGAWGGWAILAPVVLAASALTLAYLGARRLTGNKIDAAAPVPFGPALCASGALLFLASSVWLLPGGLTTTFP